ncbi:hypothetical protein BRADI_2g23667v3 [Brachypodium distachyon]|uniref:Uncharacterized protein n=1 Tax=Brachypodium distachyon TaxID=15368 RepID=A0A2K2DA36_BRADI|nr:hypothetical protein BRADI_2g23667v3 [Brachypodium distachyon]
MSNRSLYPAPENLPRFTLAPHLDNLRVSGVHIYAVRGTLPTKCPNDYNDFGQWLSPDEASNIMRSRYQAQKKQHSNSAIEMASRHYHMVAIAASLRGVQVEVQSEQPYKQEDVSTKQEKNAADLELAIAISLMPFEATVASCHPAQGEVCNMEHDSSKCEDSTKQD